MSSELPAWVRRTLSEPRFAAYLRAAVGDAEVALRLYWWNIEVSAAFYGLLHCLELSLRNALHHQLGNRFGPSIRRGVRVDVDDIVAGLPFGFWVSLLSRGAAYDRQLWVPALHRAFPGYSGRREKLHDNLLAMVLFRNRIMHHEPIHHRDLAADHAKIYRLLGYCLLTWPKKCRRSTGCRMFWPGAQTSVAATSRRASEIGRTWTG